MLYSTNCCKVTMYVDYSCYECMLNLLSLEWFDSIVNELSDAHGTRLSFYCRKKDLNTIWQDVKQKISLFEDKYKETLKFSISASDIEDSPKISDFSPNNFIRTYDRNLVAYEITNQDLSKFEDINNVIIVPELGNEFIINMHSYIDNIKGTLLSLDSVDIDRDIIIYSESNGSLYKEYIQRKNNNCTIHLYDDHDLFLYTLQYADNNKYSLVLIDLPSYIFNIRDEVLLSEAKSKNTIISGILNLYERYYVDQICEISNVASHIYTGNWQNIILGSFDDAKYSTIIGNGK